jgi:hypothetical protein
MGNTSFELRVRNPGASRKQVQHPGSRIHLLARTNGSQAKPGTACEDDETPATFHNLFTILLVRFRDECYPIPRRVVIIADDLPSDN